MNNAKILNIKSIFSKLDILNIIKNKKSIIFLFLCLIVGMILGTISVTALNTEYLNKLNFLFLTDFKERIQQSNIQIFISSFFISSLFALFLELSAFSCWGMIFIPAIILFKGFGLGLCAGYLYLIYSLKGIAFYILMLLPGIFISSIGLTKLASKCNKFSMNLIKIFTNKDYNINLKEHLKLHFKTSGHCFIILILSSITDVILTVLFSRFFNF